MSIRLCDVFLTSYWQLLFTVFFSHMVTSKGRGSCYVKIDARSMVTVVNDVTTCCYAFIILLHMCNNLEEGTRYK